MSLRQKRDARAYARRLDALLGDASDYKTNPIGPLSPAQLANLDRVLTPDEQAAVDKYQSGVADQQLAVVRKQGGPISKDVAVTAKGAVIQAQKQPGASGGLPADWWKYAIIGLGIATILGGGYALVRGD